MGDSDEMKWRVSIPSILIGWAFSRVRRWRLLGKGKLEDKVLRGREVLSGRDAARGLRGEGWWIGFRRVRVMGAIAGDDKRATVDS